MLGIVLALASAAGWGTADFLGGLFTKRLPILVVAVVSQVAGLVVMLVVVAGAGEAPTGVVVLIGLAGGACSVLGLASLYSALAIGPMGVVAPIAALDGIVPLAVGLARGDDPTSVQIVGIALAIGGVVLAVRHRAPSGSRITPRAVTLAVLAAIGLGLLVVALDEGGRRDVAWTVLLVRVGALAVYMPWIVAARPSFRMGRRTLGALVVLGVLDNGANLLFAAASSTGQLLSLLAVIGSLYPVATILLARGVLDERLARTQVAGVAAALCGVGLMALG